MLLTIDQAALSLAISRRTLLREIAAGRLAVVEIRGATRIAQTDIAAYIDQSRKTRASFYSTFRPGVPVDKGLKLGGVGEASGVVFGDVGANGSGTNGRGGVSRCAGGFGHGFATRGIVCEHADRIRTVASNSIRIRQVFGFCSI